MNSDWYACRKHGKVTAEQAPILYDSCCPVDYAYCPKCWLPIAPVNARTNDMTITQKQWVEQAIAQAVNSVIHETQRTCNTRNTKPSTASKQQQQAIIPYYDSCITYLYYIHTILHTQGDSYA